ncbi:hypothetical protein OUA97_10775 [Phenylobacterium sp. 58.2.17]|nr:hypothetical protein [Phenylobacterium sp. 58.2.17]
MTKLSLAPLSWAHPDRRRLYRALLILTSARLSPARAAVARHALLQDLEIFDDPRQGQGDWLFADEVAHVERLGELLAATDDRGDRDREIQRAAAVLIRLMDTNGAGRAEIEAVAGQSDFSEKSWR